MTLAEGAVRDLVEVILERVYDSGFKQIHAGIVMWECRDCAEIAEVPRRMNHKAGCVMEDITRLQYGPRDAEDWSAEAQVERLTALLSPALRDRVTAAEARAEAAAEWAKTLSENDIVTVRDEAGVSEEGWNIDLFMSVNRVSHGDPSRQMVAQLYAPDYDETGRHVDFYFRVEKARELRDLLDAFLAKAAALAGEETA